MLALDLNSSMFATYGPKGLFNVAQGWMKGFLSPDLRRNPSTTKVELCPVWTIGIERSVGYTKSEHLGDLPEVGDILEQVLLLKVEGGSL